jgi:hypothetical protein
MYKLLNFTKPEKIRSSEEHNETYVACGAVPGVYVPNMSDEDNRRWKCKHIKGENERIEMRKWIGANVVVIVRKNNSVKFSTNASVLFWEHEWDELVNIVAEARSYMNAVE